MGAGEVQTGRRSLPKKRENNAICVLFYRRSLYFEAIPPESGCPGIHEGQAVGILVFVGLVIQDDACGDAGLACLAFGPRSAGQEDDGAGAGLGDRVDQRERDGLSPFGAGAGRGEPGAEAAAAEGREEFGCPDLGDEIHGRQAVDHILAEGCRRTHRGDDNVGQGLPGLGRGDVDELPERLSIKI
jgi:hypothetical protein